MTPETASFGRPMIGNAPVAALALLAGAVLLSLGLPRTIASVITVPGNAVLKSIQSLEPVSRQDLDLLIASQRRSLAWGESGRKWTDLGLAQLLLAAEAGDDGREDRISEAMTSLKRGLALAPANGFAWTRLAYGETLASGPSAAVAAALKMALLTAPFEPRLLFMRLELSFRAWPYFEPDDRDLVFRQVRFAWRDDPERLIDLARRSGRINLVRAALLRTPEALSRLEERLRRRPHGNDG